MSLLCFFFFLAALGLHCRARALLAAACGILVPQPGREPESPALPGKLLTSGPPGKSLLITYCIDLILKTSRLNLKDKIH